MKNVTARKLFLTHTYGMMESSLRKHTTFSTREYSGHTVKIRLNSLFVW